MLYHDAQLSSKRIGGNARAAYGTDSELLHCDRFSTVICPIQVYFQHSGYSEA